METRNGLICITAYHNLCFLLICLQGIELSCESIPGAILQVFVWLQNPTKAGKGALVSIIISALTTGFASAMIAFDLEVDTANRKNEPKFYGKYNTIIKLLAACFFVHTRV